MGLDLGKESYSGSWSGVAGTESVLLAIPEALAILFWTFLNDLPVYYSTPMGFHGYPLADVVILLLSLIAVSSVVALAIVLVFCLGSYFLGQKYGVPILFVAGIARS